MLVLAQACLASLLWLTVPIGAGTKGSGLSVPLPNEHRNASESFRFRPPSTWVVETVREVPEVIEARGDGVLLRFLHRPMETGYDGLHADCMLERLAAEMDTSLHIAYEYDFVSWDQGPHRALDSAFAVTYERP